MSVIFKKKDKVADAVPISQRQKDELIAAGLMEAEVTEEVIDHWSAPQVVKNTTTLPTTVPDSPVVVGSKVVIINGTFDSWMSAFKSGDTGVVLRIWPAIREAVGKYTSGVVEVKLDKPREAGRATCMLHSWELGVLAK